MKLIIALLLFNLSAFAIDEVPRPKDLTQKSRQDLEYLEGKMREADMLQIAAVSSDLSGLVAIGADAEGLFELFIMPFLQWKFNGADTFEDIGTALVLEMPAATRAVLNHEIEMVHMDHERHNSPDVKFWRVFHEAFTKQIAFKCPLGIYRGTTMAQAGELRVQLHIMRGTNGNCYTASIMLQLPCEKRSVTHELDVKVDGSEKEKFGHDLFCIQKQFKLKCEYTGRFDDKYFTISHFTAGRNGSYSWICEELRK